MLTGIVGDNSWSHQDLNYELTHSSKLSMHKGAGSPSGGDIVVAKLKHCSANIPSGLGNTWPSIHLGIMAGN